MLKTVSILGAIALLAANVEAARAQDYRTVNGSVNNRFADGDPNLRRDHIAFTPNGAKIYFGERGRNCLPIAMEKRLELRQQGYPQDDAQLWTIAVPNEGLHEVVIMQNGDVLDSRPAKDGRWGPSIIWSRATLEREGYQFEGVYNGTTLGRDGDDEFVVEQWLSSR
jgi:hypothetical protein